MADECDVSKIVTAFLLDTCRLPAWPSNMHAVQCCGITTTEHPFDDKEVAHIPLITGSIAEFFIEPMLPHVGDIDVMCHWNNQLAIPRGHPPPIQLPAEFHNYVYVHEIIDSHLPGYVYLQVRYLLSQCIDRKYNYIQVDEKLLLTNGTERDNGRKRHGPAILTDNSNYTLLSVDTVHCVRCLSWLPQASDWPTRHRNYGWPDSATLDRVLSNGCDVVGVAHSQCRHDEWVAKNQHRLSFSRAEIILINSWMPVQQIVYHMLRYFMKTKRLTDYADNSGAGTLSNYHIKTLMLWACELKPRSWWTDNLNLVRICVELLQTLSVWLTDICYPHYFINNYNILCNSSNLKNVANKLMSIDEGCLSTWFANNYIGQCAELCPTDILLLFNESGTSMELQNVASEIVRWRTNIPEYELWRKVVSAESMIARAVSMVSLNARSCVYWMNELAEFDKRFPTYFSAIALLQVSCRISTNGFSDKLIDMTETILASDFHPCSSVLLPHATELNSSELVELLQKSAVEHLTTYRRLWARDFASVVTIVTTDFEALYAYKRGDYQRCLQLSTENVHTLLYGARLWNVSAFPELIQLYDDDIVSLIALTVIVDPKCRNDENNTRITQVTLSLYLMTQSQLKLRHSVTSLTQTLEYIKVAQRKHHDERTLNHLTLRLIERKVLITIWH